MAFDAKATVDVWVVAPRALSVVRLLPTVIKYHHQLVASRNAAPGGAARAPAPRAEHQGIRYLASLRTSQEVVHNTLAYFHIEYSADAELMAFLQAQPQYQLDYALRACMEYKRHAAALHLLQRKGAPHADEAIDLALSHGLLAGAKVSAGMLRGDEERRKAWLRSKRGRSNPRRAPAWAPAWAREPTARRRPRPRPAAPLRAAPLRAARSDGCARRPGRQS